HRTVSGGLVKARSAHAQIATLETLRSRESELAAESKCLADERSQLETELTDLPKLEESLALHERDLAVLDDPRARVKILEAEVAKEPEIRKSLSKIEQNAERLNSDRNILLMQLESYKDLDIFWAEAAAERDTRAEAHRTLLANEIVANKLDEREKLFDAARLAVTDFKELLKKAEEQAAAAKQGYDRERHQEERLLFRQLEQKLSETRATLEAISSRRDQLGAELSRLGELRESLKTEFSEKSRLGRVSDCCLLFLQTLREAAPR